MTFDEKLATSNKALDLLDAGDREGYSRLEDTFLNQELQFCDPSDNDSLTYYRAKRVFGETGESVGRYW